MQLKYYRIQAKQVYFQQNNTKRERVYQLHTFTKGKTKEEEEENKIPKRRIKLQEGMLRK